MHRYRIAVCAGFVALSGACNDPQTFQDVQKHTVEFIMFRNVAMLGGDRQTFPQNVPGDVTHPSFEGRWVVRDPEKPVDMYVFRASDYDPNRPLADQAYFWSSTTMSNGLGQQRSQEVHVHPTPGDWLIVFSNPAVGTVGTRTDVSADISLSFFK